LKLSLFGTESGKETKLRTLKISSLLVFLCVAALIGAEKKIVRKVLDDGSLKVSCCCSVRLAGVVFPAGLNSGKEVEYYNFEALEALQSMVGGKKVTIDYVKPGNWFPLRRKVYVYVDTVFVNAWLLRQGHALWDGKKDHRLAGEFAEYEKAARKERKGLWLSPFNQDSSIKPPDSGK
jgi:endonuclease YncB( thermonuclease family)